MKKLLSIALCTYNGSAFLQEQLESFIKQKRQPDELVVFDDCSTDNTVDIIQDFAKTAPFPVRLYINRYNFGSNKNFEQAVRACQGEIIALADQDDVWMPDKLSKLEYALRKNPDAGYVFSDAIVVDSALRPLGYRLWESSSVEFNPYLQICFKAHGGFDVLLKRYIVTGATMAFRAILKEFIFPFPENWVHDGWIAFMSCAMGYKGIFIKEPLLYYRQHAFQQIGALRPKRARILGQILKKIVKSKCNKKDPEYQRHLILEFFEGQIRQFSEALYILEQTQKKYPFNSKLRVSIERTKEKIRHMQTRSGIIKSGDVSRGVSIICQELFNRRYFQYSPVGWYSLLVDFILSHKTSSCH